MPNVTEPEINPQHPIFGEAYRMLEPEDVLTEGDQSCCLSTALSRDGEPWHVVTKSDYSSDVGKTIRWYRDNSDDADRGDRLFKRAK